MSATKREYLAVPYEQRQTARSAGARWDATAKSWFIGEGADREKLARWLPGAKAPELNPREEFMEAMREHGLVVVGSHPIADGKPHRSPVEGDRVDGRGRYSRPSGRYALHLDGHPAGFLKNYRKGTYTSWKSTGFSLPPEEMAVLRAEVAQREQERAEERSRAIESASERVQRQVALLKPATSPTGYMKLKGIAPTAGALTDRNGVTTFLPAIDAFGKLWTMQTIRRDGYKLFEEDSRKEGTFHIVGGDLEGLGPVTVLIMSEGYATAAIVAEAASQPVIAAFDAGNLHPVARALHARFPDKLVLVAGDDDRGVELREGYNPGREKATSAAIEVDGLAVFPVFAPGEVDRDPRRFTDFHDLGMASVLGRPAVEEQIRAGLEALSGRPAARRGAGSERRESVSGSNDDDRRVPRDDVRGASDRARAVDAFADRASNALGLSPNENAAGTKTGGNRALGDATSTSTGDLPSDIAARYLVETSGVTGRKGFFENHVARQAVFYDDGHRLSAPSDSAAVVTDIIAIAAHRGWRSLEVTGSESFRREAWFRAQAMGLQVEGYRPTERDVQVVARQAERRSPETDQSARKQDLRASAGDGVAEQRRQYLSVPFAEKDQAKAAGAKWDRDRKSWYADQPDPSSVARWIPSAAQQRSEAIIARDPKARAQMRTIEAVAETTLGSNPEARNRVLQAGRDTLADHVAHNHAIAGPLLRTTGRADAAEPAQSAADAPKLPNRRPPDRTRGR